MDRRTMIAAAGAAGLAAWSACARPAVTTEVARWPGGKAGAVSLTYDDNSPNQFRVALPLMRRFGLPATFHVITGEISRESLPSWGLLKGLTEEGFEISSHSVTHAHLDALDDANLAYELDKSRRDILDHLGPLQTFTVECPYGTEDERVVRAALERYPASRNRLPEPFLEELNRDSERDPRASAKEYVQWQRGVLTATPMDLMTSWVDITASRGNIWLVLVFHGVDGVGWEPKTGAELESYFSYIRDRGDQLWVATFRDVVKYMRERMSARVASSRTGRDITVELSHDLPRDLYDLPLTLRTAVPADWDMVEVRQAGKAMTAAASRDGRGTFVQYRAAPNGGTIVVSRGRETSGQ